MSGPILEARGITKVFTARRGSVESDVVAVDDVSFALAQGGCTAVVGESGSGKTTLARIICGLETPTSGQVLFEGSARSRAVRRQDRLSRAKQIQMVFQDPYSSLDPRQTGFGCLDEVLRVHAAVPEKERRDLVSDLGDQVGLGHRELHAPPRRLSGGQRQRLAIARALAVDPSVLVLDEAVSALDVSVQAQILNLLVQLREARGLSYVFVSHDLAVVRQVSENVIVMRRGAVVEEGPTGDVLASPQAPYTQALLDSVPRRGWRPRRSLLPVEADDADA
jgi:ABC-type glutathione transport system ATPase component